MLLDHSAHDKNGKSEQARSADQQFNETSWAEQRKNTPRKALTHINADICVVDDIVNDIAHPDTNHDIICATLM